MKSRMSIRLLQILTAIVLVGPSAWSQAAPAVAPARAVLSDRAAIDSGRQILLAGMRRSGIPGASVTVLRNGREIWTEGLGIADIENRVAVTPLTKFRIGSVSKPITAVAMAALVEDGKLDLDAPIQRYVPGYPDKGTPITARELAGHLAGIRHYRGDEFLSNRHYANVTEPLAIFANDTLLSRPGEKYNYSTYGFVVLSAVIGLGATIGGARIGAIVLARAPQPTEQPGSPESTPFVIPGPEGDTIGFKLKPDQPKPVAPLPDDKTIRLEPYEVPTPSEANDPNHRAKWWNDTEPRIPQITQFDHGPLQGSNCVMAAGAMLAELAYGVVVTASDLRAHQSDQDGPSSYGDLNQAMKTLFGVGFLRGLLSPTQLRALSYAGAGVVVSLDYGCGAHSQANHSHGAATSPRSRARASRRRKRQPRPRPQLARLITAGQSRRRSAAKARRSRPSRATVAGRRGRAGRSSSPRTSRSACAASPSTSARSAAPHAVQAVAGTTFSLGSVLQRMFGRRAPLGSSFPGRLQAKSCRRPSRLTGGAHTR